MFFLLNMRNAPAIMASTWIPYRALLAFEMKIRFFWDPLFCALVGRNMFCVLVGHVFCLAHAWSAVGSAWSAVPVSMFCICGCFA